MTMTVSGFCQDDAFGQGEGDSAVVLGKGNRAAAVEQAGVGEELAIGRGRECQRVSGGGFEDMEEFPGAIGRLRRHAPGQT
jgi:hypothetical protein